MQSAINPSTHIRPLGEEHLRMFRRTVQEEKRTLPRIVLPPVAGYRSFVAYTHSKILDVVISDKEVTASEFLKMTPPEGFRRLTKRDGGFMWLHCEDFRNKLYEDHIWTGDRGLKTKAAHRIAPDGTSFEKVGAKEDLSEIGESWHFPGNSLIALNGGDSFGGRWLGINASMWRKARARPAFVREEKSATLK